MVLGAQLTHSHGKEGTCTEQLVRARYGVYRLMLLTGYYCIASLK
jgi:hypothetical protein